MDSKFNEELVEFSLYCSSAVWFIEETWSPLAGNFKITRATLAK